MIDFDFKHEKRSDGRWNSYLVWNKKNKDASLILLKDIVNKYVKDDYDKKLLMDFIQNHIYCFVKCEDFFESLNDFCKIKHIVLKLNNNTQHNNFYEKFIAHLFEFCLCSLCNHINSNLDIKMDDKGICCDIYIGNIKIDAKTKNGNKEPKNITDWELTVAPNSRNNNNQADYYIWGLNSKDYRRNHNSIIYTIAGIIDKNTFYKIAKHRDDEYLPGCGLKANKGDYVIKVNQTNPIESILGVPQIKQGLLF